MTAGGENNTDRSDTEELLERLRAALRREAEEDGQDLDPETEDMAELLIETMDEEEARQMVEEAEDPEKRREREQREAREALIEDFLSKLHESPTDADLPEDFWKDWERLVSFYERRCRDRLKHKGKKDGRIEKLVRRGWVTADAEKRELVTHLERPPDERRPIPAVFTVTEKGWCLPETLMEIIRIHPYVRAVTDELPVPTTREEIEAKIQWAQAGRKGDCGEIERSVAGGAEVLDLRLGQSFEDSEDSDWLGKARESERFWEILDAAIGFGRMLERYGRLNDGRVEALVQKAVLVPTGKKPSKEGRAVEQLIEEFRRERDETPTAKKLAGFIGAKRGASDDDPLEIPAGNRASELDGVSWTKFQILVKGARVRMEL
jgi:hypothetical protein